MARRRRLSHPHFGSVGYRHEHTLAQRVSQAWRTSEWVSSPQYGPHHVIQVEVLQDVVRALTEKFQSICFYSNRHIEIERRAVKQELREDELQQVADRFYLRGRIPVCDFLRQHRSLINLLLEARSKIDEYFNPALPPSLELFTDPEDIQSRPKLFALIRTTLGPKDASTRLDRFDQEWWLHQAREVRRVMNIDVDYVDADV
ncbi:MAG TPA: hypothetical protein VK557_14190 [Pyrinomonadaceae bacterium]|nr:hypothetical protein [Pyrinomonadaceae bacterium]